MYGCVAVAGVWYRWHGRVGVDLLLLVGGRCHAIVRQRGRAGAPRARGDRVVIVVSVIVGCNALAVTRSLSSIFSRALHQTSGRLNHYHRPAWRHGIACLLSAFAFCAPYIVSCNVCVVVADLFVGDVYRAGGAGDHIWKWEGTMTM